MSANSELSSSWYHIYKSYQLHKTPFYDFYGGLSGQVIYKVVPKLEKIWKYENGLPLRECNDFELEKIERHDCGTGSVMVSFHKEYK